ncbi:C-type lectin 37Db-like [Cylas formicarius]|uniref:C-type lectin 37Db-like n=1 Tax=Cylas formicarius TaxID=197179 RepID=UPI00295862BA|nr:C-type lectin 37Db-like [Cylas formicarius]
MRLIESCALLALLCSYALADFQPKLAASSNGKYYVSLDKANFFQAFLNCRSAGLQLASIRSQKEEKDIEEAIKGANPGVTYLNGFWTSGTNLANIASSQYYWLSTGGMAIYTKWLAGEPNNQLNNEHCLEIFLGEDKKFVWNDSVCTVNYRYVCQDTI